MTLMVSRQPTRIQYLQRQAAAMLVDVSDSEADQLLAYVALLHKWNKAYNLTAIRDPDEMIERHLLDSLAVVPWIKGPKVIDVGTGPGIPGIILSIMKPDIHFSLLDSNGKKTRFLKQCQLELGLQNTEVFNQRAEQHQPPAEGYDQVISRAFSSLENMTTWCRHLVSAQGEMLAMKGQYPEEEIQQLPSWAKVRKSHALQIPGCGAQRHLLIIGGQ